LWKIFHVGVIIIVTLYNQHHSHQHELINSVHYRLIVNDSSRAIMSGLDGSVSASGNTLDCAEINWSKTWVQILLQIFQILYIEGNKQVLFQRIVQHTDRTQRDVLAGRNKLFSLTYSVTHRHFVNSKAPLTSPILF
jgi:hypothetical protein